MEVIFYAVVIGLVKGLVICAVLLAPVLIVFNWVNRDNWRKLDALEDEHNRLKAEGE